MPGSTSRRESNSGDLPEDAQLAYARVLSEMKKYKVILQQIQQKLTIGKVKFIRKDDVQFFIDELERLVEFVQAEENKPFMSSFLSSAEALCTIVEVDIALQLEAVMINMKGWEQIDTTTPNYADVRETTFLAYRKRLLTCREPLERAIGKFTIEHT